MADLAKSAVTILESWLEVGTNRQLKVRRVKATLSGQGGGTDKINASLFDLTRIYDCSSFVKSDDSLMVTAAPSKDQTHLLLKAAGTNAPANNAANGDYYFTVKGI